MSCRHDPTGEIYGAHACEECAEIWEADRPDLEELVSEMECLAEGFRVASMYHSGNCVQMAEILKSLAELFKQKELLRY